MNNSRPAEVFHPGEYLEDELTERGWTQGEFAEIINRPVRLVNEIINGKRGITTETAVELSAALGTSPEYWLNLETAYQLWNTKEDVSQIKRRAKLRSKYPIREMIKRGWLLEEQNIDKLITQLMFFFDQSSLDENPPLAAIAATKRAQNEEVNLTELQLAWLYRVKQLASGLDVPVYSSAQLENTIQKLIDFRASEENISFIPALLKSCGIRFVIVEPIPGSKIDGVAFWIDENSPVIGMSLRFDRIDNFWFVLRHEIEHIFRGHGKKKIIIDAELEYSTTYEKSTSPEFIANSAAADFCVPQKELKTFFETASPVLSKQQIIAFASSHNTHPGMVVGQLQRMSGRYDLLRPLLTPIRKIICPVAITDGYQSQQILY